MSAMSTAQVVAVAPGSPAEAAGVLVGDELVAIDGEALRDVIRYRVLSDAADPHLELRRDGEPLEIVVSKEEGSSLGVEVDSPVFDRVRTCDNHCEFCFIYQLPKGMRRSLYLKDDDYRLSFLYGNFTTLTRFTEADLERVVDEHLSPLFVSIHATDPEVRADMLRNPRGGVSLRWLRALLDFGIEVHGQIVCCPGINDGDILDDTLCGVLDEYPELADVAVVPLGVSKHTREPRMRPHSLAEAQAVVDVIERWQHLFGKHLGHPMVYAADEYYLMARRPFPDAAVYGDFGMHEDGIGMARAFELEFEGAVEDVIGVQPGFFASVDGAPAVGYRAPRNEAGRFDPESSGDDAPARPVAVAVRPRRTRIDPGAPVGILSGTLGAGVIEPLVTRLARPGVRVIPVENRYFGGNVGVTGLMVGDDLVRVLAAEPAGHRYLLPDVCLSEGRFLDGLTPADLPRPVEVVPTDGRALRVAIEARGSAA